MGTGISRKYEDVSSYIKKSVDSKKTTENDVQKQFDEIFISSGNKIRSMAQNPKDHLKELITSCVEQSISDTRHNIIAKKFNESSQYEIIQKEFQAIEKESESYQHLVGDTEKRHRNLRGKC